MNDAPPPYQEVRPLLDVQQMPKNELPRGQASTLGTFANITKAIVGAGSFALPYAFKNMGLVGGCVIISLSGILCFITCCMIVGAKNRLIEMYGAKRTVNYVDVGRATFGLGGAFVVYALTLLGSIGGSGVYMNFVGSSLHSVYPDIKPWAYMFMLVALELPLVLQGSAMKMLGYTSIIGDICLVIGMAGVLTYGFKFEHFQDLNLYPVFEFETAGESFGSVAFLFCVNFLIFPIENGMKNPKKFATAIGSSMVLVTIFNAGFGLLGYMLFFNQVCSNVVLNLTDHTLGYMVKFAICLDLTFSYPLVIAPAPDNKYKVPLTMAIRIVLILLTVGIAQIKTLGQITDLVGGFSLATLAFVTPPLIYMKMFGREVWEDGAKGKAKIAGTVLLLLFGLFAVGLTTYMTIRSFVHPSAGPTC